MDSNSDLNSPVFITNEEMRGIDMNQVKSMQLKDGTIIIINNENEEQDYDENVDYTLNEQLNQFRARPMKNKMINPLTPNLFINPRMNRLIGPIPAQPPKAVFPRGPNRGVIPVYNGPILRGKNPNIKLAVFDDSHLKPSNPPRVGMPGMPLPGKLSPPNTVPINPNPNYIQLPFGIKIPQFNPNNNTFRTRPNFTEEECDFQE